jgi:WD40 repeat protein
MATFTSHVDSIDCSGGHVAVSLSNLEGNIWDGGVSILSADTGEVGQSASFNVGAPIARFAGQDGCVLAAGRDDGSVSLHAVSDLSKSEVIAEAHSDSVSSICASGTSAIITAGWDGDIHLWDLACPGDKALQSIEDAHHFPITEVAVAPPQSPSGGALFASVGMDGFLRTWDSRTSLREGCVQIHNLQRSLSCVAWDPTRSSQLFMGTDGGAVLRCDTRYLRVDSDDEETQEFYASPRAFPVHGARVRRLHVLPGPGLLLSVSDDGCLALSSTRRHTDPSEWSDTEDLLPPVKVRTRLPLHSDYVTDLAVVRDLPAANQQGHCFSLFTASTDKTMRKTTFNTMDTMFNMKQCK